jgi:hypothetical protein
MVAFGCMAIAFAAFWALHMSSFKVDIRTNNESRAAFLANQRLETLRSAAETDFAGISSSVTSTHDGPYTIDWTITSDWASTGGFDKKADVTVSWNERTRLRDGTHTTVTQQLTVSSVLVNLEM